MIINIPDKNMVVEFPDDMDPQEVERQLYKHVYDQDVISEMPEQTYFEKGKQLLGDVAEKAVGAFTTSPEEEAFKPYGAYLGSKPEPVEKIEPIISPPEEGFEKPVTVDPLKPEEHSELISSMATDETDRQDILTRAQAIKPGQEPGKSVLSYAPYMAVKGLKGLMGPTLPALKALGMDTEGLLNTAAEYWGKKLPDVGIPNAGIVRDEQGDWDIQRIDDYPLAEIVGETTELTGYMGPVSQALKAGGLVAEKVSRYARPFYQTVLKGMIGGALLGEGKKDETLQHMAMFGLFEGAGYAIGKIPAAVKGITNSNAYRKATIKERGLVVQDLETTIKQNPGISEADLVKTSDAYFAEALAKRRVPEGIKPEPARPVEPVVPEAPKKPAVPAEQPPKDITAPEMTVDQIQAIPDPAVRAFALGRLTTEAPKPVVPTKEIAPHEVVTPETPITPEVPEPKPHYTENTLAIKEKYRGRNDAIKHITDRAANFEKLVEDIKSPEHRQELKEMFSDKLIGDHGGTNFQDVRKAVKQLEAEKIPYVYERADGGNLGGLNAHHKEVHSLADKDVRKVWGEIYADEVVNHGGIIGRDQGDEFIVVWPNFSLVEVKEIRADIEGQIRNRVKELGLENVPHPKKKYGGMPTGALYTNYGLIEGQPGKYGEMDREADMGMAMMKDDFELSKAEEVGYTYNKKENKYEPGKPEQEVRTPEKRDIEAKGRIGVEEIKRPGYDQISKKQPGKDISIEIPDSPDTVTKIIEKKYSDIKNLPESNLSHRLYQRIVDGQITPSSLSRAIKRSKNPNIIKEVRAAIADTLGDLQETYRYEGAAEGRSYERYIDSLLDVAKPKEVYKPEKKPAKGAIVEKLPKEFPKEKKKKTKVRTIRGAIKEKGGINFGIFKGELRDMPVSVKFLSRKTGVPLDLVERELVSEGWMTENEALLDKLREDPEFLKRAHLSTEIGDKPGHEKSTLEKKIDKEMGFEPEPPPEGDYKNIWADELPENVDLTILDGSGVDGWDVFKVKKQPDGSIKLEDGRVVELAPFDKLDVLKSDLPAPGKPAQKQKKETFYSKEEPTKPPPTKKKKPLITEAQKKAREKKKAVKETQLNIESAAEAKKAVHSMVRDRRYNLNLASYETNKFINDIQQDTTRAQREIIPFIIEKTPVPKKLNRPDLEKAYSEDKENLKDISKQVQAHFDKGWQKMKKHIPDMSEQEIENYVTHIWDIPRSKKPEVTNWFTTKNRFLKQRYIETLQKGIEELGLKPKVLDIGEIIQVHDAVSNRAIENQKFVDSLKTLKKEGVPLIERADKAPQDWTFIDHPSLRKALVIPGELKKGEKISPELENILYEMGVAIGRRINPTVFGKPSKVAGLYKTGEPPEIRFQRFMKTKTIAHEIGHHIDTALGLGDEFLAKHKNEIYAINRDRIEKSGLEKGYTTKTSEQIAETFALLFTDPNKMAKLAPATMADALEHLKQDGAMSKLINFDFEKKAKNLIEEQLNTLLKLPVKVHPDIAGPMKVVFDSRFDHPIIQAYEGISGVLKKTSLSLSLFHHLALGETGAATIGPGKVAGIYFNPAKIYKSLMKGQYDVFKKEAIAKDAIGHGLQLGATSDIPVQKIQGYLNDFASKTKNKVIVGKAAEFLRTFNEKWDAALWDYLHDTLKLYAYESLAVKNVDYSKDSSSVKSQKEEVAQFVNDTFGGQNWDVLMVSPKTTQIMTWALLSADWTASTFRQALSPTGIGAIHKEDKPLRKKMGRMFWLKAALYFGAGINMLNYTFRAADRKKNPEYYKDKPDTVIDGTMPGNAIGHKTHLFVGRYEDGTERYIRWGKQFRELPEMFMDDTGFSPVSASIKKIGGKANPLLQLTAQITTGHSLSGFKNDDISGKKGWDKTWGIAKTLIKSPLPFSSRSLMTPGKEFHITDIAMPSSKGMSRYKAMSLFKTAIVKKDDRFLKEIYQDTLENNLPAYTLFNAALTSLKAEETKEYNKTLKDLKSLKDHAPVKTPKEATILHRKIKRLIKEKSDKEIGLKMLDKAIVESQKYSLEKGE